MSHAFIVIYDVTDRQSFKDLEIAKRFVVGTKIDLQRKRKVKFDEAEKYAQSKSFRYCEVSAKSGRNINQLFTTVALYVLRDNVVAEFDKRMKRQDSIHLRRTSSFSPDKIQNDDHISINVNGSMDAYDPYQISEHDSASEDVLGRSERKRYRRGKSHSHRSRPSRKRIQIEDSSSDDTLLCSDRNLRSSSSRKKCC